MQKKHSNICLTFCLLCLVLLGSTEKRAYLLKRFPQLSAESFANSRDTSFEQHVLLHTQGKGLTTLLVMVSMLHKIIIKKKHIFSVLHPSIHTFITQIPLRNVQNETLCMGQICSAVFIVFWQCSREYNLWIELNWHLFQVWMWCWTLWLRRSCRPVFAA